jgi:hypothetical protein
MGKKVGKGVFVFAAGAGGGAPPPPLLPYIVGGAIILLGVCYGAARRKDEPAFYPAFSTSLVGVFIMLFFGVFDLLGW